MTVLPRFSEPLPGRASLRKIGFALGLALLLLQIGTHTGQDPLYRHVDHLISPSGFAALDPVHREMLLAQAVRRHATPQAPPMAFCWAEGTDPEMMAAFDRAGDAARSRLAPSAYHEGWRWSATATNGPGLGEADPMALTWGILPDGTQIGSWSGEPASYSRLIQLMDGIHGEGPGGDDLTQRPWFRLFKNAFEAWGNHIGVQYVYEPNDDRAAFPDSGGVLGVRPDVRIGSHPIDGASGVYGINDFPNGGDMLLDSQDRRDIFGAAGGDYRMLRNLVGHEHGHGLGLTHACPDDGTKLMEPIIRSIFDGPQEDDIIFVIRAYGDRWEIPDQNDDPVTAYDLGTILPGDTVSVDRANIDGITDEDYFAFTVTGRMRVSIRLTPTGLTFYRAPDEICSQWRLYEASAVSDLAFGLHKEDGSLLTQIDAEPVGKEEFLPRFIVPEAGTYLVHVTGDSAVDEAQRYELEISVDAGTAPVALCKDREICRDTVTPFQLDNGSFDPDGDPLQFTLDPPGPYPPGENIVRFIVDDGALADTCESMVTVNAPPVGVCAPLTVEVDPAQCGAYEVAAVDLDDGSFDPEGKPLTLALDPPGPFSPGTTPVKFLVTDSCGAIDTCETTITVDCQVPVRLLAFRAERRGDDALVHWETAAEAEDARFHLYREEDGLRERRTELPLSGRTVYEFTDRAVPSEALRYWLEETDRSGAAHWHGPLLLQAAGETVLRVAPLVPNPFAATTALTYSLPVSLPVRIAVYDVRGRRVRLLTEGVEGAGSHRAEWDGTGDEGGRVAAGLYLLRVEMGRQSLTRKVVFSP